MTPRPDTRATAADPLEPIAPIVLRVMTDIIDAQEPRQGSCAEPRCEERALHKSLFCALHDVHIGVFYGVAS